MRTYERRDADGKLLERTANIQPGSPYDEQLYALACQREDAGDLAGWWLAGDDGDDGTGGDDERYVSLEDLLSSARPAPQPAPAPATAEQDVDAGQPQASAAPRPARARGPRSTTSTPPPAAGQE